ncbi:glycosyltransferase family 4 protein [Frankia sp. CNm7]|uniref:Glycosyltransferase family 4 protein n=1 Tax=Frankia nepalensis TaxID=1836974 RepID=A0A937ULN7_9ACTN|nr:glycosyltransferase family 4 protein [Frankia nepalensis]MBL7495411.1 glycosyltransferase family 4 protein [Frankia nepalensis]MBL7514843.1 glycosyltransferase family 4 protein [Frankia nepalensis]MBL7522430.1 glycosyltransferase family 4 protein [Frankia nepalensis]MBL7625967.1 glycosyltransferase family 4 protein [Frankia nepalensis]
MPHPTPGDVTGQAVAALAGRHVVFLNWRDLDHPQAGGAELFCQSVAGRFAAAGVDVTLLTARPPGLAAKATVDGVQVWRGGGTFGVYPSVLARLARLARSARGVDAVVDCQNGIPFFSPLVLPAATPVVQVLHHVHQKQFPLFFPGPVAKAGQLLEAPGSRWVYRRRPLAAVSPSTRDEARAVLRLPGPRFLVPNGVTAPAGDAPVPPRAASPTIVCVGRLVPHKRLHLLLEAIPALAARHPGLVVHLVGSGPDRERLEARAAELGIAQGGPDGGPGGQAVLRWHGHTEAATRDALLAGAWLTVNPSHGEGWGLSVLEANALGVPAVAFRVPGLRDAVLDGRTGWLVDSPARLADTIDAALTELGEPARAAALRDGARGWAAGFSWEASAALLATVLSGELARAGRPDHRRPDDVVTRAWFPLAQDAPPPALRRTDLVYRTRPDDADGGLGPGAVALLYGASPAAARAALDRAGVAAGAARLRAATGSDLLVGTGRAWGAGGGHDARPVPAGLGGGPEAHRR